MTAGVNEMLNKHHLRRVAIKGGHSKQDLWYTQTPLHLSIFTTSYNILVLFTVVPRNSVAYFQGTTGET